MTNQQDGGKCDEAKTHFIYRSFLLRLRYVVEEGDIKQQIYLKDIHTQAEFYFTDPQDIVRFLDQLQNS